MIHRTPSLITNQQHRSRWLMLALMFAALVHGQTAWAVEDQGATNPSPSTNALGIQGNPLRYWVDENLRTWAYRYESTHVVGQVDQPGYYRQYFTNYQTTLRATKNSQTTVYNSGTFVPVVDQHQQSGSTITTGVTADSGAIRIVHSLVYTDGEQVVRHQWQVTNTTSDTTYQNLAVRYGGDTFFGGFDEARGYYDAATGFVYCANPDNGVTGLMGMQPGADSPADSYFDDDFETVVADMGDVADLPNSVNATFVDNGMALEWRRATLAPGGTFTITLYEKWTASGGIQVLAPVASNMQTAAQRTFLFRVQNLLTTSEDLNVGVNAPPGWLAAQPTTPITVAAGGITDVPVDLTVPSDAVLGAYSIVVTVTDVETQGETYNQTGTLALTIQAPPLLPVDNLPGGSSLPLSSGQRTVYTAISPSTMEGKASILAALAGRDHTITRAFAWDPAGNYAELPGQLPPGGLNNWTGIFIATRVPLNYSLNGTSSQAPFTLDLPAAGWVFAGVPPLDTGFGLQTTTAWSDVRVVLGGEITLSDVSSPTLAEAMGNPATPLDSASAQPYFWNGSNYVQVDTIDAGKAYWFKNNLDQPLQVVVDPSLRQQQLALSISARRISSPVAFHVRDQGSPPPPPSSSSSTTSASSSSGGGCGMGSGIASLAFLMLMIGLRFFVVRR
jgi:hypothetical protein